VRREGERDYSLSIPEDTPLSPLLFMGEDLVWLLGEILSNSFHCIVYCIATIFILKLLLLLQFLPHAVWNPSIAYFSSIYTIRLLHNLLNFYCSYSFPPLIAPRLPLYIHAAPLPPPSFSSPPPLFLLLLLLGGGERPLRPQSLPRAISLSFISLTGWCGLDSAGMTHLSAVWQRCTSLEKLELCE
jgi:hypothetical protein